MVARRDRGRSRRVAGAPAHLVGHSMGTLVAQHVAVEAPELVRSLTLFGPIVEPADAARERLRERARKRAARRHGRRRRRRRRRGAFLGVARGAARSSPSCAKATCARTPEGFAQSCEALADARAAPTSRLIRAPTLIVTGDEDGVAPPARRAGACRQGQGRARSRYWSAAAIGRRSSGREECGKTGRGIHQVAAKPEARDQSGGNDGRRQLA